MEHPLLAHHQGLLSRWRDATNLVGPGPLGPHYDDAFQALDGLAATGRWADLGTGAGLPGIVFAAMFPDVELDLVDSRQKRCAFVERVIATAPPPLPRAKVLCLRVEELSDGVYDGLISRAFAPPPEVLVFAQRLLKPGGRLVLFLQADADAPPSEVFHVEHERTYLSGGKGRKAVWMRFTAAP